MQLQVALQGDVTIDDGFGRGDECSDASFHIDGATSVELAIDNIASPGIEIPAIQIANGHDINMSI